MQRKIKYTYEFEKIKKTLNLIFDFGYKNKIIDIINIINGFIDQKKKLINDILNNKNKICRVNIKMVRFLNSLYF